MRYIDATMPRKGWRETSNTEDLGDILGNCEACGTAIRYQFEVVHPNHPKKLKVGSVCVHLLTENYKLIVKGAKPKKLCDLVEGMSSVPPSQLWCHFTGHKHLVFYKDRKNIQVVVEFYRSEDWATYCRYFVYRRYNRQGFASLSKNMNFYDYQMYNLHYRMYGYVWKPIEVSGRFKHLSELKKELKSKLLRGLI